MPAADDRAPAPPRTFRLLPPGRQLGWVPYGWLVYLGFLFIEPVVGGWRPTHWAITLAATATFLVSYFRGHWVRGAPLVGVVAFQTALGVALTPTNYGASVFFIYAASFAGWLARARHALALIAAVTLVGLASVWLSSAPPMYWITVLVFPPLIGGVNLHFTRVGRANARLRLAQAEIEHLAAVAERERIGRDLHDVLGHTLSLIILKSELASKLAERDPARAAREIRDVEQVSRKALAEVREAIRGYRATLDDEVAHARALLDAAGIRGEFALRLDAPDRARDEVLALVLREMVTNAARHSGARVCRVTAEQTADGCTLVVEDDGGGRIAAEGAGLRGMRERIAALGGTLAYDGTRGTRLTATIPLRAPAPPAAGRAARAEGAA